MIIGLVVGYFIRSGHYKESDEDVETFSSQEMDSESEETEEMAEESPVEKAEEPAEPEEAEPLAAHTAQPKLNIIFILFTNLL